MPTTNLEIKKPSTFRLAVIGGCAFLAAFLWISTFLTAGHAESGDVPRVVFQLMFSAAACLTVCSVVLGTGYLAQQACATNQTVVLQAVGQLAGEVEQLSEKMSQIDPMQIYAAVAGDLLNQDRRT